jgi:pimeloyl-ACP methyl ester carboxylesterase
MIRRLYPLAFVALLAGLGSIACSDSVVDGTNVTHTTAAGRTLSATYLRPNVSSVVPTLILLHQPGPTNSRHDFDEIWDALVGEGYALLAPDLQSHGYSDSGGPWQELALNPEGYPDDVMAWLDFVGDRADEGDPVTREAVGVIGLGTSGSVAAAAIGRGQVDCVVAVSATIAEINALHVGFPIRDESGDDDDSASGARGGDDDDSAGGDDDDSAGDDDDATSGDDDDATIGDDDDDDGVPLTADVSLHTVRWMVGSGDVEPAADSAALLAATSGEADLQTIDGTAHGVEILWLSDATKVAMISWCGDKF